MQWKNRRALVWCQKKVFNIFSINCFWELALIIWTSSLIVLYICHPFELTVECEEFFVFFFFNEWYNLGLAWRMSLIGLLTSVMVQSMLQMSSLCSLGLVLFVRNWGSSGPALPSSQPRSASPASPLLELWSCVHFIEGAQPGLSPYHLSPYC